MHHVVVGRTQDSCLGVPAVRARKKSSFWIILTDSNRGSSIPSSNRLHGQRHCCSTNLRVGLGSGGAGAHLEFIAQIQALSFA